MGCCSVSASVNENLDSASEITFKGFISILEDIL